MNGKTTEALIIGFLTWLLGVLAIVLFAPSQYFPRFVGFGVFAFAGPFSYLLTKFHLRNVDKSERGPRAIRFGVIITLVQFPLDATLMLTSIHAGYPNLSIGAQQAVAVSLPIAYFWLLAVPWWMGLRYETKV